MTARTEALCTAAASVGLAAGYALVPLLHPPMFWLDPVELTWSLGAAPGPLAMGYFARAAYGLSAALLLAGLARLAAGLRAPRRVLTSAGAVAAVLALAASLAFEASRVGAFTFSISPGAVAARAVAVSPTEETP
ncbi:MAG: hypothetical protein K1X89_11950 [Myxococcaceae bacterium]|nr:hypothetical protein [Myxococcaceae bacterium]